MEEEDVVDTVVKVTFKCGRTKTVGLFPVDSVGYCPRRVGGELVHTHVPIIVGHTIIQKEDQGRRPIYDSSHSLPGCPVRA